MCISCPTTIVQSTAEAATSVETTQSVGLQNIELEMTTTEIQMFRGALSSTELTILLASSIAFTLLIVIITCVTVRALSLHVVGLKRQQTQPSKEASRDHDILQDKQTALPGHANRVCAHGKRQPGIVSLPTGGRLSTSESSVSGKTLGCALKHHRHYSADFSHRCCPLHPEGKKCVSHWHHALGKCETESNNTDDAGRQGSDGAELGPEVVAPEFEFEPGTEGKLAVTEETQHGIGQLQPGTVMMQPRIEVTPDNTEPGHEDEGEPATDERHHKTGYVQSRHVAAMPGTAESHPRSMVKIEVTSSGTKAGTEQKFESEEMQHGIEGAWSSVAETGAKQQPQTAVSQPRKMDTVEGTQSEPGLESMETQHGIESSAAETGAKKHAVTRSRSLFHTIRRAAETDAKKNAVTRSQSLFHTIRRAAEEGAKKGSRILHRALGHGQDKSRTSDTQPGIAVLQPRKMDTVEGTQSEQGLEAKETQHGIESSAAETGAKKTCSRSLFHTIRRAAETDAKKNAVTRSQSLFHTIRRAAEEGAKKGSRILHRALGHGQDKSRTSDTQPGIAVLQPRKMDTVEGTQSEQGLEAKETQHGIESSAAETGAKKTCSRSLFHTIRRAAETGAKKHAVTRSQSLFHTIRCAAEEGAKKCSGQVKSRTSDTQPGIAVSQPRKMDTVESTQSEPGLEAKEIPHRIESSAASSESQLAVHTLAVGRGHSYIISALISATTNSMSLVNSDLEGSEDSTKPNSVPADEKSYHTSESPSSVVGAASQPGNGQMFESEETQHEIDGVWSSVTETGAKQQPQTAVSQPRKMDTVEGTQSEPGLESMETQHGIESSAAETGAKKHAVTRSQSLFHTIRRAAEEGAKKGSRILHRALGHGQDKSRTSDTQPGIAVSQPRKMDTVEGTQSEQGLEAKETQHGIESSAAETGAKKHAVTRSQSLFHTIRRAAEDGAKKCSGQVKSRTSDTQPGIAVLQPRKMDTVEGTQSEPSLEAKELPHRIESSPAETSASRNSMSLLNSDSEERVDSTKPNNAPADEKSYHTSESPSSVAPTEQTVSSSKLLPGDDVSSPLTKNAQPAGDMNRDNRLGDGYCLTPKLTKEAQPADSKSDLNFSHLTSSGVMVVRRESSFSTLSAEIDRDEGERYLTIRYSRGIIVVGEPLTSKRSGVIVVGAERTASKSSLHEISAEIDRDESGELIKDKNLEYNSSTSSHLIVVGAPLFPKQSNEVIVVGDTDTNSAERVTKAPAEEGD